MAALLARIKTLFSGRKDSAPTTPPRIPQLPRLKDYKLSHFDRGVFAAELAKLSITPDTTPAGGDGGSSSKDPDGDKLGAVQDGTVVGTQLALTDMMNMIESQ